LNTKNSNSKPAKTDFTLKPGINPKKIQFNEAQNLMAGIIMDIFKKREAVLAERIY